MKNLLIIIFLCFLCIGCILENKKELNLTGGFIDTPRIGKKGTISASLLQEIKPPVEFKDFSRKTYFKTDISENNNKNKYEVDCGIWNENFLIGQVSIFCNLNESIPAGNYTLLLAQVKSFDYNDYRVNIHLNEGNRYLNFEKSDKDIIDLYSGEQNITLEDGKEKYEIKFNIVSYHQENLYYNFYFIIDNCKPQNDILICPITKSDILKYIYPDEKKIVVWYLNIYGQVVDMKFVPRIKIIVPEIQRKEIFVGINKLLINANAKEEFIAYETNITEVSNIYNYGNFFHLTFMNKIKDSKEEEKETFCRFIKYDNNPLILLCKSNCEGTNWIKTTTNEKIVDNLGFQYTFRIQPITNDEKFETFGLGSYIDWRYPNELDFTKTNDTLSFDLYFDDEEYIGEFTFIEDEEDLKCEQTGFKLITCQVPKKHFKGKETGLYFIKHKNHINKKSTSYEVPPIKVILPSKENIISSSLFYSLLLFLIMI